MPRYSVTPALTFTSPATETTAAQTIPDAWTGLDQFDWFTVYATLTGATGGTLDVYLQAEIAPNVWVDWLHFPQKAAASAATSHVADCSMANATMATVGIGTTAAPGVTLAASTVAMAHPGHKVRVVAKSGSGTSAGASQTLYLVKWRRR